jgi:hypothetical protein
LEEKGGIDVEDHVKTGSEKGGLFGFSYMSTLFLYLGREGKETERLRLW